MSKKLIRVGRQSVKEAIGFGYNGCHKIYVAESPAEIHSLQSLGYKIHPMDELERIYADSCPLRFISWEDDSKVNLVRQCAKSATFVYEEDGKETKSVVLN